MNARRKDALTSIFDAALRAVDPVAAVDAYVRREGDKLFIDGVEYDLSRHGRVLVAGGGKGAAPMAQALEIILGDKLADGVVVVKYGHGLPLAKIRLIEAAHPVPDEAGVAGSRAILDLLRDCQADDLVLFVFTGGASALLPAPHPDLTLAEKQAATRLLLACGATIHEVNAIRKHLSRTKAGRLVQAAHPASCAALIISDVIGDDLSVIASGPTSPDPTSFADCLEIISRYGIEAETPPKVLEVLRAGAQDERQETPKPGDPVFSTAQNVIIASNKLALAAARDEAERLGYAPLVLTSRLCGEARESARTLAAVALEVACENQPVRPPAAILAGGETTVTLTGQGKGGRNQEFALACAMALEGRDGVCLLSAGTDGTDGPTDAAGAFALPDTLRRARENGVDARLTLASNDSYRFFQVLDDLLITGPTRTNVMDLVCILVE